MILADLPTCIWWFMSFLRTPEYVSVKAQVLDKQQNPLILIVKMYVTASLGGGDKW